MKTYFFSIAFLVLSLVSIPEALSQIQDRTITVTGSSTVNLSPNEIILKISFQEYFLDKEEKPESKVVLEVLEEKVRKAIGKSGINKEKITLGSVQIVQPYKNGVYQKRRLNKSLFVCVENTQQHINLARTLEEDNLFDETITDFSVIELRHTEKESYLTKSRSLAYGEALKKAKLILSQSGQQLGKVIRIKELNNNRASNASGSFYSVESTAGNSGFSPIVISYNLEVTFEIKD
ncbi:SIMPL domain-containing protein [Aquimarina sp. 2304DJ70-9]|uniref:SIMPL domain-containing protein n=1 Tax=Aquimarina penaris TaxID=3231044 RepID=UPI00346213E8